MNQTTRTLTFVGVAVLLVAVAYGTHVATRPASLEEFTDVGDEFYPDFDDPLEATGLRVAAYNDDAARVDVFSVEREDGRWTIPSHHNYPADGEERLANTANSIIGLSRGALVSTSPEDHKRLGVLDPLDESLAGTEGRGDRITLTNGDDVLVDYIVGDKIEDGPENTYHVRRADEPRTYRATLDLDISTKFADWIEPDLLEFRRGDLRELVVDRYSIDETQGVVVPGEQIELSRSSQDDPWKLEGLDEATEQVKTSAVNEMVNALEDLSIVGVRRKPAGLSASLRGEEGAALSRLDQMDLEQKGFFVDSRGMLVSNEGDVRLGTAEGVMYVLRFGEVFTGSDVEIEVGSSSSETAADTDADADTDAADPDTDTSTEADADTAASSADESDDSAEEDGSEADSLEKSRYVFITTQFNEAYIDPLEQKPVKPEPPAGAEEKSGEESKPDEADSSKDENEADAADSNADETTEPAGSAKQESTDQEQADPQAEYEKALEEYEAKLKEWEQKEKQHQEKIESGKERVQELNQRFADWYYVISAQSFDDIRKTREQLVEAKEPETPEGADSGLGTNPAAPPVVPPNLDLPGDSPSPPASSSDIPQPDDKTDEPTEESNKPASDPGEPEESEKQQTEKPGNPESGGAKSDAETADPAKESPPTEKEPPTSDPPGQGKESDKQ